jgi:hypothetical protein
MRASKSQTELDWKVGTSIHQTDAGWDLCPVPEDLSKRAYRDEVKRNSPTAPSPKLIIAATCNSASYDYYCNLDNSSRIFALIVEQDYGKAKMQ